MSVQHFSRCRPGISHHVGPVREVGQPQRLPWSLFLWEGDRGWPKRGCLCARFGRFYGLEPRDTASGRSPAASVRRARAFRFACGARSGPVWAFRDHGQHSGSSDQNRPASARNTVRHHTGILSAINPEPVSGMARITHQVVEALHSPIAERARANGEAEASVSRITQPGTHCSGIYYQPLSKSTGVTRSIAVNGRRNRGVTAQWICHSSERREVPATLRNCGDGCVYATCHWVVDPGVETGGSQGVTPRNPRVICPHALQFR
jgi:hypothetical protein